MNMSRTINRSIAKRHYAKFSRLWRDDLREAGLYGKARSPKRPTFNQWYALQTQAAPKPADMREQLGISVDADPWDATTEPISAPVDRFEEVTREMDGQRGVMTIPIAGDDE